eukprot:366043-Chlamydomonas_euryale.AAC.2
MQPAYRPSASTWNQSQRQSSREQLCEAAQQNTSSAHPHHLHQHQLNLHDQSTLPSLQKEVGRMDEDVSTPWASTWVWFRRSQGIGVTDYKEVLTCVGVRVRGSGPSNM